MNAGDRLVGVLARPAGQSPAVSGNARAKTFGILAAFARLPGREPALSAVEGASGPPCFRFDFLRRRRWLGRFAAIRCYNRVKFNGRTCGLGESMRLKSSFAAILLLISLVVTPDFGPFLSAQTALPTPQELDQLLAPVALYPDSLLAQITTASTNPQEILDVDNWLQENQGLTGTALTDGPATGIRSGVHRAGEFPASAGDDGAARR